MPHPSKPSKPLPRRLVTAPRHRARHRRELREPEWFMESWTVDERDVAVGPGTVVVLDDLGALSAKQRPAVLISPSVDPAGWWVMTFTSKPAYRDGTPRVAVQHMGPTGLVGQSYLWGSRLTFIPAGAGFIARGVLALPDAQAVARLGRRSRVVRICWEDFLVAVALRAGA